MRHYIIGLTAIGFALTGCTDIKTVRNQTIVIETPLVTKAECELVDTRGHKWYVDATPKPVTVMKGYGPMTIDCTKKGYKRTIVAVDEVYGDKHDYQHVATSAIGAARDITMDIGKHYPYKLVVLMEPEKFGSEQEKIDWLTAKHSYEKMYQEERDTYREVKLQDAEKLWDENVTKKVSELKAEKKASDKAEAWIEQKAETKGRIDRIEDNIKRRQALRQLETPASAPSSSIAPTSLTTGQESAITKEVMPEVQASPLPAPEGMTADSEPPIPKSATLPDRPANTAEPIPLVPEY